MEPGGLRLEAFGSEVTQVKGSPVKESKTSYLKSYFGHAMLILVVQPRCSSKMLNGHSSKHVYIPTTQIRHRTLTGAHALV